MPRMQTSTTPRFWPALCILLVLALLPHGATAQPKNGSEITLAAAVLHFGYQEFDDYGTLLDREDGNIPGFFIGLSHASDRWVFAGDVAYHTGDVTYSGQTQAGTPVITHTLASITDLSLHAEYWPDSDYAFYLGGGHHQWDRDIQSGSDVNGGAVSGLLEHYTWWSGFVGVKAVVHESRSANWTMDLRLLQTINPAINLTPAQYDNVTMPLGERMGVRFALPWRHKLNLTTSLNIEPYAESFEFGRSATTPLTQNGTVVGSLFEPRSQTINYGMTLGVNQRF